MKDTTTRAEGAPESSGSARITLDDFNRQISPALREKLTISEMQEIISILSSPKRNGWNANPAPAQSGKLSIAQLAARLGVHTLTIRRRIAKGEINVLRMGRQIVRIEMSEVERIEALLKQNKHSTD